MRAIASISGGLDSSSMLHVYKDEIKKAAFFNMGSPQNKRELIYARWNCTKLGKELIEIDVRAIFKHVKSPLLIGGDAILPGAYPEDAKSPFIIPFRNGVFISILASIAESNNLDTIMLANHKDDSGSGLLYPDCTGAYIAAMNEAVQKGLGNENVRIVSPWVNMTKAEVVELAKFSGVDFAQTYSCYTGNKLHCGVCGTCIDRKKALGKEDKTKYEPLRWNDLLALQDVRLQNNVVMYKDVKLVEWSESRRYKPISKAYAASIYLNTKGELKI